LYRLGAYAGILQELAKTFSYSRLWEDSLHDRYCDVNSFSAFQAPPRHMGPLNSLFKFIPFLKKASESMELNLVSLLRGNCPVFDEVSE
jgi:hypothetical protein